MFCNHVHILRIQVTVHTDHEALEWIMALPDVMQTIGALVALDIQN